MVNVDDIVASKKIKIKRREVYALADKRAVELGCWPMFLSTILSIAETCTDMSTVQRLAAANPDHHHRAESTRTWPPERLGQFFKYYVYSYVGPLFCDFVFTIGVRDGVCDIVAKRKLEGGYFPSLWDWYVYPQYWMIAP